MITVSNYINKRKYQRHYRIMFGKINNAYQSEKNSSEMFQGISKENHVFTHGWVNNWAKWTFNNYGNIYFHLKY